MALVSFLWLLPGAFAQDGKGEVWYEVDQLNEGLSRSEDSPLPTTPRNLIERFLDVTDAGRFTEAAAFLNLEEYERSEQAQAGPDLAKKLSEVFHSRVVIDWSSLPERPDGMNVELPSNHPFAGKPRRTLKITELAASGRPLTISISRYKVTDGEVAWLFSPETVANIPRLYELYGPAWLVRHIPHEMKAEVLGSSVQFWELIALPGLLIFAALIILAMRWLIGTVATRLPFHFIQRSARKIRAPLAIAVAALIVQYLLDTMLSFSGPITSLLTPILLASLIFCMTLAILRMIDTTLELVTDRYVGELDSEADSERRHRYTNIYAARRYVLLVAFGVTVVLVLMQLNLFDSLGMSLLASAGVATVVLGIAGQTVLGNLLASLQIAIAKPIRIGDAVQYDGKWCYVEAIYYTFITLRSWDSRRVIVPVKHFISSPFENWTMTDAKTTRSFTLELDLNAEPAKLRSAFEEMAAEEEHLLKDEMLLVAVEGYTQSTQKIVFYATADTPSEAWTMNIRLCEKMGDWVRKNHPDWWPRLRLADPVSGGAGDQRSATAAVG